MSSNQLRVVDDVLRSDYQKSVANYWNTNKNDPVNLRLGDVDGYYHHHYGIGDVDWSVLEGPEATRDDRVIRELHRLEHAQARFLIQQLGGVAATIACSTRGPVAAAPASWSTSTSAAGSTA